MFFYKIVDSPDPQKVRMIDELFEKFKNYIEWRDGVKLPKPEIFFIKPVSKDEYERFRVYDRILELLSKIKGEGHLFTETYLKSDYDILGQFAPQNSLGLKGKPRFLIFLRDDIFMSQLKRVALHELWHFYMFFIGSPERHFEGESWAERAEAVLSKILDGGES